MNDALRQEAPATQAHDATTVNLGSESTRQLPSVHEGAPIFDQSSQSGSSALPEAVPSAKGSAIDCWCRECHAGDVMWQATTFVVCPGCGCKRCPHAGNHADACTGSTGRDVQGGHTCSGCTENRARLDAAIGKQRDGSQALGASTVNPRREGSGPDEPDAAFSLLNLPAVRYLSLAQMRAEFPTLTRTRGIHGSEPWDYSAGEAS